MKIPFSGHVRTRRTVSLIRPGNPTRAWLDGLIETPCPHRRKAAISIRDATRRCGGVGAALCENALLFCKISLKIGARPRDSRGSALARCQKSGASQWRRSRYNELLGTGMPHVSRGVIRKTARNRDRGRDRRCKRITKRARPLSARSRCSARRDSPWQLCCTGLPCGRPARCFLSLAPRCLCKQEPLPRLPMRSVSSPWGYAVQSPPCRAHHPGGTRQHAHPPHSQPSS